MKKTISGIMLLLLFIGSVGWVFSVRGIKANSRMIYVDDDNTGGPWDGSVEYPYQNVTSGLEHAAAGDVVFVFNGTYYENIWVNKSVSLLGENKHGTIIDGNFTGDVILITANNVNVSNFTIRNSRHWVSGYHGVLMENYSGNTLSNNIIENNFFGIELYNCSNNTILDNQVFIPPHWLGIVLSSSTENTLTNNTLLNGYIGILLGGSNQNVVNRNEVKSNFFGIRLANSNNNTIFANEVVGNRWGVYIASYTRRGDSNLVYHNNFVNNSGYQGREWNSTNRWDNGYPFGGNYWSNYTGVDVDGDGIGDTPYIIPAHNNRDNYPLMEPWSPPTMTKTLIRTVRFWKLPQGIENSLTAKLESALLHLETGKEDLAVHKLTAFINQVQALSGTKLTEEQAEYLTTEAKKIITLIRE